MVTERISGYSIRERRLPSLDGMRGVAILLVVISHLGVGAASGTFSAEWVARLGAFGVKIFFVLSGFLITTLLVSEHRRTGRIAVGRFFIRRAFRIFPPAYVYILAIVGAASLGWIELRPFDTLTALTYTMNFNTAPAWWLGHTWSLSVEEQFYLVWPLALLLARPRGRGYMAASAVIAAPLVRGLIVLWIPGLEEGIDRAFLAALDGFAAGGLLAILRDQLERRPAYVRWLSNRWLPLLLPVAAVLDQFEHHPLIFFVFLQPIVYLSVAIVMHRAQVVTDDRLGRLLNWRPLTSLGVISYSLYLWQEPFLAPIATGAIQVFPFNLILALLFAWASYRFIERPCLRWRDRWFPARAVVPDDGPSTLTAPRPESAP